MSRVLPASGWMTGRNVWLAMLAWTLLITTFLGWNLYSQRQGVETSLHMQAEAVHSMEMEYRNWVIQNGGVYVPVSDRVQPSPWLTHVPERDIRTPSGKALTLLNSSYVVRLVHQNMRLSGSKLRDHIASLNPINPVNAADPWERRALESFARGAKVASSFDILEGGKSYYRYMKPMVTEESCLKCHARYGDKLGDIRGGVSVAIPADEVMLAARQQRNTVIAGHGLIWVLGLTGLFLGGRRQQQAAQEVARSERTLQANEERLHLATGAGNIGVWDWDIVRNELTWDESMYVLYGIHREDFGGAYDAWISTLHPEDRPYADGEIQAALRGEREYAPEFRILRPDGSVRNIKAASRTYYDAAGKPLRMVGTNIDITELRRAETIRNELAAIVESTSDAIIGKDLDGIITSWNKGAEKIYGYRADEIVGRHVTVLVPPAQHAEISEFLARSRNGEAVTNHESERLRKDGTPIQVALTLSPIRDAAGRITGISTIARDITDRKRLEEQLQQASAYHRSLIEASLDPLVTISAEGKITDVNRATEQATGCSRAELVDTDFSEYFTEPEEARKGYRRVFAEGSVTDYPLALRHRDGRIIDVLYNASVYRSESGEVLGVFAAARDITARKKAETVLRESEAALKEAQRLAHVGSWHMDLATNEVYWSEELYKMYGYDPALPPPLFTESMKLFTPESWERLSSAIARAVADGTPYELELEMVTQESRRRWMQARGELVHDEQGKPVRVRGVVMDITARKLADEELRHSEHGLAEAQRIAHLGNWELDLKSNALHWSDEIYRIFEIDQEKFGASYDAFLNAIHPDDRDRVNRAYTESVAQHEPYEIVHRLRMADGRIKYVNEKCETYYDAEGNPLRSVGTVHDITERVLDEQALQRLNRELRAISNCNQVLMRAEDEQVLLNEICRIICEDAGYRMAWVGYAEQDEAKTIRVAARAGADSGYLEEARLTWADSERGRGPSGSAIRSGRSVCIQDFLNDPKAAPWREAALQRDFRSSIALPLQDEAGRTFGILNIYATMPDAFTAGEVRLLEELAGDMAFGIKVLRTRLERQRAEAEVHLLNQQLEQRVAERTQQLEAANKELEAFAYSVSHDLRTPLRAIDGFSNILLEDYHDKLDDEGRRVLNVVRDNALRMGQLIDDILKFSRAGRLELSFVPIDMEALVREVLAELHPEADADRLQLEISHLPPASGDRAMMRQVWVNLLSNALKFSRNCQPARIKVGCSVMPEETVYYVQDNGAGFDMQYVERLFGVFQRLHGMTEFEGTGIGLAIVKRIVARHGGRVWAEGRVGEGATFHFALPHAAGEEAA